MITSFLDTGCKLLKSSQELQLGECYSAVWVRIENSDEFFAVLRAVLSMSSNGSWYCWFASHGSSSSSRVRHYQRAFGKWGISRKNLVSERDYIDHVGSTLFSDIVRVDRENIDSIYKITNGSRFGIDSNIFFIPDSKNSLVLEKAAKPLTELLMKRSAAEVLGRDASFRTLLLEYIAFVSDIDGLATVVLRDSDMRMILVAIGRGHVLDQQFQSFGGEFPSDELANPVDVLDFAKLLSMGVSISVLG